MLGLDVFKYKLEDQFFFGHGGSKFVIPEYQREFSWTKDQWEQLYQDIVTSATSNTDHFIGTFVLIPKGGDNNCLSVVDGQQRLTTLSLLFGLIQSSV